MNDIRCFAVFDRWADGPHVLVWASSPSRAKAMVRNTEWFSDSEWPDLRAKRCKECDGYRKHEYDMAYATDEDMRYMRDMGWVEWDGSGSVCDECDLSQWEGLDESYVGDDGLCEGCRKKGAVI